MARQAATSVENNFSQGLITETTALNFPEKACTDMDNVIVEDTGRATRRYGFDLEPGYTTVGTSDEEGEAIVEYRWESAAGSGDINFLVIQKGRLLYFYDISDHTQSVSPNFTQGIVDLTLFENPDGTQECEKHPCQFAISRGDLIVVNRECDPIFVRYNPENHTFSPNRINITVRDLRGLEDGLEVTERPSADTLSDLISVYPDHYYNLFNQGWFNTDALTQWDTARTDFPSNADYFYLYRSSATDAFDNARVDANSAGNRPAPRGHAILDAFKPDRNAALAAEGLAPGVFGQGQIVPISGGTDIGTIVSPAGVGRVNVGLQYINDGIWSQTGGATYNVSGFPVTNPDNCARNPTNVLPQNGVYYCLTLDAPTRISAVRFAGPSDRGYHQTTGSGSTRTYTVNLYGKTGTAPTSVTDGDLLGTTTFPGTRAAANSSIRAIVNGYDTDTAYEHVWIHMTYNGGTSEGCLIRFAEVEFNTFGSAPSIVEVTEKRPSTVASYAGRVFYGGIAHNRFNNEIYFTQILETDDQYGKCYQKNDPSSEVVADLLADDGGVVKIPEMGQLVKMHRLYNTLLLFASNGVWALTGPSGDTFRANDYSVSKISNIGSRSPYSFVDVRGIPTWWAEDGIYTVQFNPDYGSAQVLSISEKAIRSYLLDIPSENRKYVKGTYDTANDRIIWAYNTGEINGDNRFHYDKFLCFNTTTQAFFPLSTSENAEANIVGLISITYAEDREDQVKFLTKLPEWDNGEIVDGTDLMTFSIFAKDQYFDWVLYAENREEPDIVRDYNSFFITGYKVHGQTTRDFQTNYVWVFLDQVADSSVTVQSLFEWTNSGNSGRWSTPQQAYNPSLLNRHVNYRRLKLRGSGKAVQLKFQGESGKPFSIIGFSIYETSNAGV